MNDKEQIRQRLECFLQEGLVNKSMDGLMPCFATQVCGIGVGEQGFVCSHEDIRAAFCNGIKPNDSSTYSIELGRVESIVLKGGFAFISAQVNIISFQPEINKETRTQFQQSLAMIHEDDEWKICGLHATLPTITDETLAAYPLNFAAKTLSGIRKKIDEEANRQEEQYRHAVLMDAIAIYIVNFTEDRIEKCQLQNNLCVHVEPDAPYSSFINDLAPKLIYPDDTKIFLSNLSLQNILSAFDTKQSEICCQYRSMFPDGSGYFWKRIIVRLVFSPDNGECKGIIYVKNVDDEVRATNKVTEKSDFDDLTGLYNKAAMIHVVNRRMQDERRPVGGILVIADLDDFGRINEAFGYAAGDKVLAAVGPLLRESFGEVAVAGRLGGSLFGLFLPGEHPGTALQNRTARLMQAVHSITVAEAPELSLSVSIGIAHVSAGSFDDLYPVAIEALTTAKANGKNT